MYLPAHFAEPRVEVLHEALRRAGLATLVTSGPGGLDAAHVPLLVEPTPAPLGRLVGHVARANPIWSATPDGSAALAIVLGPDAYVTPAWYPSKREHGKVVPTWNYVAIHAHGTVRFFHERDRLLEVVTRLTDQHEARRLAGDEARRPAQHEVGGLAGHEASRGSAAGEPWRVSDAPADYVAGMLKAIVGVELTVTRLEGKWKASQNRSEADRRGVEEGLRSEGREAMARLVGGGEG